MKSRTQTNPISVDKSTHVLKKKKKFFFRLKQAGLLPLFRSTQLWKSFIPDFIKLGWMEYWGKVVKSRVMDSRARETESELSTLVVTI